MKSWKLLLVLLLTTFSCALARPAGPGYQVTVHVVRIPANHADLTRTHSFTLEQFADHVRAGHCQVLDTTVQNGTSPDEAQSLTGSKIPVTYFDPRANGFQVQYVDEGFKLQAKPKLLADGRFQVDGRVEILTAVEGTTPLVSKDGLLTQTTTVVRPGQVSVLAWTRGRLTASYLKRAYPNVVFAEGDVVLFTVSIHKI